MPDVCLYFQVHQPNRLLPSDPFRIGENATYEDEALNRKILNKVSEKCYLPADRIFKQLIDENEGRFRIALCISGIVIEQMERYRPDVLESFQELVGSGGVELLAETYYHSLAFVHSNKEFDRQVEMHLRKIEDIFSVRPRIFRNTELIYNDSIGPLLLDGHQGRPAWQIPFRYEGGPRDCESVAFAQDGKTIYTISEGRASPIVRYREKELIPPSP